MEPPPPPPPVALLALAMAAALVVCSTLAQDAAVMSKLAAALSPMPSGWGGSNTCKWTGVTCNSAGNVASINLASRSLSGVLPPDLNQLSALTSLSLQKNNLSGALPPLSGLSHLREAFLDRNSFSSLPPPSSFLSAPLPSLAAFSISDNPSLPAWTFPPSLPPSLLSFSASRSNLAGPIPDVFSSLPSLLSLRLSYNSLSGRLPPSLAASPLQTLLLNNQVAGDGLSGTLSVLSGMTRLTQLWLHVNAFSGPVPDLSNCTSLADLQLRDNRLSGVLPASIPSLPALVNLSLDNNRLQGPLPVFPASVSATLGSRNSFCRPDPGPCSPQVSALLAVAMALGYPMQLAESWEGDDACSRWDLVSCDPAGKNVTSVNFGRQGFPGVISPAFADLPSLESLLLNDNHLAGTIPPALTGLPRLRLLDLSNNNLSGAVPRFSVGVTVKISGNPLIGQKLSSGEGGTAEEEDESQTSSGIYAGVAAGAVAAAAAAGAGAAVWRRRRRREMWGERKKVYNEKKTTGGSSGGGGWIPIEVLREVTENFAEGRVLGRGGFGVVYKGELPDGTEIAVKRMEGGGGAAGAEEFQAEIGVLTKARHRNLVSLFGYCVEGGERLLVYEYMAEGTLGERLHGRRGEEGALTWQQRITIALDVGRGVEYLHSMTLQSFIHRDLKPSNILLGLDLRAKVSDFGLVKNAPDGKLSLQTRLAGTFGYLAPEYASTGRVTTKVDVFAFGVVLMELISGRKALDDSRAEEDSHLLTWFRRGMANKEANLVDSSLEGMGEEEALKSVGKVAQLALHCTNGDPRQRPTMSHSVAVLSQLVEQWKPSEDDYGEGVGIDLHMSLPQALLRWQAGDDNNTTTTTTTTDMGSRSTTAASRSAIVDH